VSSFDFGPSWWLVGALALAIAELIAPGFFLVFIAAGAAITGLILLALPGLPLLVQVTIFGAATAASVGIGRRWYHRSPVSTDDPLLNDRAARLVGEIVVVTEPISAGVGRVRVGDGAWPARGPDAPSGARVRVIGTASGELLVELA
jgi:hypothetical protein